MRNVVAQCTASFTWACSRLRPSTRAMRTPTTTPITTVRKTAESIPTRYVERGAVSKT